MILEKLIDKYIHPTKVHKYRTAILDLDPNYYTKLGKIFNDIVATEHDHKYKYFMDFLIIIEDMKKNKKYEPHIDSYMEIYQRLCELK